MTDPNSNPPPLPPTTLNYQSPGASGGPVQSSSTIVLRFFIGLGLGAIVSTIIWIAGWNVVNKSNGSPLLIVPGIKLVAGIVCVCFRGWRSFGAGILVSIALGALILFGSCFAHLAG